MGTFTLTGPGASVDRSQNNVLSWTWTQVHYSECVHRWRLQYRTVGSGTWLNAIIQQGTNLLPNGSAESALSDWYLQNYQSVLALNRVAGGRHAGSGSWMAEVSQVAIDQYDNDPTLEAFTVTYPADVLTVPVTPGGRYVASGWVQALGTAAGTRNAAINLSYRTAGGAFTGSSAYNPGRLAGGGAWDAVSADKVAPSDAAYAVLAIDGQIYGGIGGKTNLDDFRLERVDNSPDTAVNDATGSLWAFRYTGDPEPGQIVLPPNFLAAGDWEFRLEAWTARDGVAPIQNYSNTVTSTMVTAAAAPTITSPANGSTVATNPANVTVTYASGQTQVQVRVMDGGTVKYDSGAVAASGTSATLSVPFADNGTSRQVQARTSVSGVWSSWATNNVTVQWTPPATPTLTAAWEDTYGIGGAHAIRVTATNPTPTGTQPTVTTVLVEYRLTGTTAASIAGTVPAGTPFVWHGAPARSYEVRVTAYAANGTSTSSAWQAVTGTPGIKGVVLYDPANPSGVKMFRLNDEGAEDEEQIESALLTFSGRQYPVAEFGAGTSRQIAVPLMTLRQDADVLALKALLRARVALVYRDKRGRAVLARMTLEQVKDAFYGYTTGLSFDVLDSWGA